MGLLKRLFGSAESQHQAAPRAQATLSYQSRELTKAEQERRRSAVRARTALRDEYLTREEEGQQLVLDEAGLPTARLVRDRDRLLIKTNAGGLVNPKSTLTYRLGIYQFSIRGTSHHGNAPRTGDFSLGAPVRLEREPGNEYDPNAVAVYAWRARSKSGYINKANAKRIAQRLDAGEDLIALSVRGDGPGSFDIVPHILVTDRRIMEHLGRCLGLRRFP